MDGSNSTINKIAVFRAGILILAAIAGNPISASSLPKALYNRDIRPILSENCFVCHGTDRGKRQANLRLDMRTDALAHGAIVPGHPEQSQLVTRIMAGQSPILMPPATSHKSLTPAQKNLVIRWIKEGAVYQEHWAYVAPQRVPIPVVKKSKNLVKSAIDAFIFSRLEEKKILPSPTADPRTLLRRVSLDITGLPPTPQEIQDYLSDHSPNAYEKVVDRLMKSPHYGERMAVPWLDVVRYADTVGFHGDQNSNAWVYRDYVINSFNNNKPFDQFTREQLAGDILPNPTPETRTATCFIRLTMMTREGGAQAKEYIAKYAADRVRTVGMAWLGSTLACCECHDHKYDPFSTKDFYSMGAFFADIKQWGVYAYYDSSPDPELHGVGNDHPFPPEIKVESPYLIQRIARAKEKMKQIAMDASPKTPEAHAAYDRWRAQTYSYLTAHPDGWAVSSISEAKGAEPAQLEKPGLSVASPSSSIFRPEPDGSILISPAVPNNITLSLRPDAAQIAAIKIELLPRPENSGSIFRSGGKSETLNVEASIVKPDGSSRPLNFRHTSANYSEPRYDSGAEIIGIEHGWKLSEAHTKESNTSAWTLDTPISLEPSENIGLTLKNIKIGCIRVSCSPLTPRLLSVSSEIARIDRIKSEANPDSLLAYLTSTTADSGALTQIKEQEAEILACRDGKTPVMVAAAVPPPVSRILPRGNWQNENGEIVTPCVPHFLPQPRDTVGRRLTRLDLANWIVSNENPLTARVFVNRLWKQFFGMGLSDQVEDLGTQGELPIHPELLDWLALEFREHGWDIKHIVKLIVMSSTYRQSSRQRIELRIIDPANRLFSSQNPRRLDAEFIRDNALQISGLLTADIGGPPSHPYQPAGYYANIQFPDRDYIAEHDGRQWRRGMYTHWQRTFLHPMLANFGAPSREDCTASRIMANSPQQALTLLNDPEFVEAARVLAAHILSPNSSDSVKLEKLFTQALARSPTPNEKQSLLALLKQLRLAYQQKSEDAKNLLKERYAVAPSKADPRELAAWTNLCRVVLNLHETITRY